MKDETARRLVDAHHSDSATAGTSRRTVELEPGEALRLLGSVPLGRIVFSRKALPAVRPVNHVLDDGDIIIRTHDGTALVAHASQDASHGVVVAYQADAIDLDTRLGWSVVATGYCHLVTDPQQVARYQAMLHPWSDEHMDHVVRIHPDLVTGIRLLAADNAS